jgi:4,5-dihydroxyphthalate decarboxylase
MAITATLIASTFTEPILAGQITANGIDLEISSGLVDDNTRGMIAGNYDVAEMSIGTYVQVKARGADFVALPVFPARRFMQPCIYVPAGRALAEPSALRGKRVAIPQFWMTSSVWHRGVLTDDFGVAANELTWVTTNDERVEADLTPGVSCTQIMNEPLPKFFTMADDLVANGTVDAILAPKSLGKTQLAQMFSDPIAASLDYLHRTGIYPLMHTVVVRGALVRERPELVRALQDLFVRGKEYAYAHPGKRELELPLPGLSFEETRAKLGGDPFPYGIGPNVAAIEAFLGYAHDQGLAERRVSLTEAFVDPS